jgi:hypothetical protein
MIDSANSGLFKVSGDTSLDSGNLVLLLLSTPRWHSTYEVTGALGENDPFSTFDLDGRGSSAAHAARSGTHK